MDSIPPATTTSALPAFNKSDASITAFKPEPQTLLIVVAPADHIILKEEEFKRRIQVAIACAAKQNVLVTLGITPTRPDTGYGYIQFLEEEAEVKRVKTFTEKPHLELAEKFIASGDYVWNAGIFIWHVKSILTSFNAFLPEMAEAFQVAQKAFFTVEEKEALGVAYKQCRSISIDNGVMEKARDVKVILADIGWSDLGTWKSLYEIKEKDEKQNVIEGKVLIFETEKCIIKTPHHKLVVVHGLQNFIVAEHGNALMICPKEQEQQVKLFVEEATKMGAEFS